MKNFLKHFWLKTQLKRSRPSATDTFVRSLQKKLEDAHPSFELNHVKDTHHKPYYLLNLLPMKNIKLRLISIPVFAIAVFAFFSLFGTAPLPEQALSEYTKNLKNAVLYQKTEIRAGKDMETYMQKVAGEEATPSNIHPNMLQTFTMESWTSEHSFLEKSHGSYTLILEKGDKKEIYVSKHKTPFEAVTTQDLEKLNGSGEELMLEGESVRVVVSAEGALVENENLIETLFNPDSNNIFQNLEKFQDNKDLTKLPEIKENGRTLVGYRLALSTVPRGAGVVVTDTGEIADMSEITMLNEDEKQFMDIYFDKKTKGIVKQVDLVEVDGTKYEFNVMNVVTEHWIPNSEVGDLFDPNKYELEKISGKNSFIQVK